MSVVHLDLLLESGLLLLEMVERVLHRLELLLALDLLSVLGPDVVRDRVEDRLVSVRRGDGPLELERLADGQSLDLDLVVRKAEGEDSRRGSVCGRDVER